MRTPYSIHCIQIICWVEEKLFACAFPTKFIAFLYKNTNKAILNVNKIISRLAWEYFPRSFSVNTFHSWWTERQFRTRVVYFWPNKRSLPATTTTTKMEEMKPIVNQQKQREDPRKLARILFYVWSGVTGIMWCYFMMLTGVRTHSIMRTAQAHQEKYRDGLEPIPYTMRCKWYRILQCFCCSITLKISIQILNTRIFQRCLFSNFCSPHLEFCPVDCWPLAFVRWVHFETMHIDYSSKLTNIYSTLTE